MTEPLRVALIGAGAMGRQHHQHLRDLPEGRLCAVADPGPQAEAFAAECAVAHFADHRRMLDAIRPQAVIVANPNNLHVGTALDCIAAGVPGLLEKPVGVHLDQGPRTGRRFREGRGARAGLASTAGQPPESPGPRNESAGRPPPGGPRHPRRGSWRNPDSYFDRPRRPQAPVPGIC